MVKVDTSILRTSYDVETGDVVSMRVVTDARHVNRVAEVSNAALAAVVELDQRERCESAGRRKIEVNYSILSISASVEEAKDSYRKYMKIG